MGILDDAIREHLELKRKHGAASDDLERLEKEAFGPPTRPGDPDFEEDESTQAASEAETTLAEAPPAPGLGDEQASPGEPEGEHESVGWLDEVDFDEPEGLASGDESDASPAEQARVEHSHLQDTVDHPALADLDDDDGGGEGPPEPPEAEIFGEGKEAEEIDFGDLDLDLDLEDEPAPPAFAEADAAREAQGEAEPSAAAEAVEVEEAEEPPQPEDTAREHELPPAPEVEADSDHEDDDYDDDEGEAPRGAIFDLEDDEEDFEDRVDELEASYDEGSPPAPVAEPEGSEKGEVVEQEEDDDLLEETPDFLQDAPEGERLWFEQGEPKDFDFDD